MKKCKLWNTVQSFSECQTRFKSSTTSHQHIWYWTVTQEKVDRVEHHLWYITYYKTWALTPHYPWRNGVTWGTAPQLWGGTWRCRKQTSSRSAWASCQWGGVAAGQDTLPSSSWDSLDGPAAASVQPWGCVAVQSASSLHNSTNDNEYKDDDTQQY